MTVTIGSTDITKYIKYGGISFSRNDVEAPDAGRDLAGTMHRGRVAIKQKVEIETIPLNKSTISSLMTLIEPETISVTINPYPSTNASKTMTMYSNNVKVKYIAHQPSNELQSITFPLVEV